MGVAYEGKSFKEAEAKFGVIASSEPITEDTMLDIEASVRLMNELGIEVKFGKHAFQNPTGYRRDSKT